MLTSWLYTNLNHPYLTVHISIGILLPVVPRVPLESPASSELNEEEESPDADYDLDDYDSEEEKRKKKRRPPPKSSKSSGATPARTTRSSDTANDRPFLCTGEHNIPPSQFYNTTFV